MLPCATPALFGLSRCHEEARYRFSRCRRQPRLSRHPVSATPNIRGVRTTFRGFPGPDMGTDRAGEGARIGGGGGGGGGGMVCAEGSPNSPR